MANLGFYTLPADKSYTDEDGFTASVASTRLMHNGIEACATLGESNTLGLHVRNAGGRHELVLNGEPMAADDMGNELQVIGREAMFGRCNMLGHSKCVNVSMGTYRKLLKGELINKYKKYNPNTIYNIVSSASARDVSVAEYPDHLGDVLYNNLGSLPHNERTSATFTSMDAPHLSVHGHDFEIATGGRLELTYMVDTRKGDRINSGMIGDTFTVIVRDEFDNVLYKNTTYAGAFKIRLAPFKRTVNGVTTNFTGETWWSIECIDNHGVGSAVQYFDVLVRDPVVKNYYTMLEGDLTDYGITPDDDDQEVAYLNKVGFSRLFSDVAQRGYNGIVLYNPDGDIKYYISYYRNLSKVDGEIDLGHRDFFVGYLELVNGVRKITSLQQIVTGGTITIDGVGEPFSVGDMEPIDFVRDDVAEICRYVNPEDADDPDNGKIRWGVPEGSNYFGAFDGTKHHHVISTGENADVKRLKAYRLSRSNGVYSIADTGGVSKLPLNDYHYFVHNSIDNGSSEPKGEVLSLPDHFTVDMNDCTFELPTAFGINDACLFDFEWNVDTHVINGKLVGAFVYHNYDFVGTNLSLGFGPDGNAAEHVAMIRFRASRYCSVENLDVSGTLGYDGGTLPKEAKGKVVSKSSTSGTVNVDAMGYIDYEGHVQQAVDICDAPPTGMATEGYERVTLNQGKVSTVYTSQMFDFVPWTVHVKGNTSGYTSLSPEAIHLKDFAIRSLGAGKQEEMFVHFYNSNGVFLKTVKTCLYYTVKIPEGATKMRLSGFGLTTVDGSSNRVVPKDGDGRCVPFEALSIYSREFPVNNSILGCYWHDTRTCVMTSSGCRGLRYDSCDFYRISHLSAVPLGEWTGDVDLLCWNHNPTFGDLEEGNRDIDDFTINNCRVRHGAPDFDWPNENVTDHRGIIGNTLLTVYDARNVTITNCDGIGLKNVTGCIPDAYIANNKLRSVNIRRSYQANHNYIFYRNNFLSWKYVQGTGSGGLNIYTTIGSPTLRYCRSDDPVNVNIAMENSVVRPAITGTLHKWLFRNCKVGSSIYAWEDRQTDQSEEE